MAFAEVTNAALELSTRASMLAWYLHEFIDKRDVDHVQVELAAERKASVDLRVEVEALGTAYGGCDKKQVDLQLELDEAVEREQKLVAENKALSLWLERVDRRIVELNSSIIIEHEEGFNKGLRQASFLLGVTDLYAEGFDIMKDVFDGEFVHLKESAVDEEGVPTKDEQSTEEEVLAADEKFMSTEKRHQKLV
ncbi:hypothetical protein LR48_Vigan10g185500 [Vigna angularis]|uniref:Uncharacterized protein n=1 Tax=Phaseolus angularis TaxID=3914 RepID=A0A0L9VLX7_PHAAN|nr:hypothetical protein LR48_Vigan10g185500 [Vigna angularis]